MNPFRNTVVGSPWEQNVGDVESIHQSVFDCCLEGLDQVRRSGRSAAILVHGPAGGGKTHLLRRLRAHLSLKLPTATDREEALFAWVRLQTTPRLIWRTLRRTLVNDWFRPLVDQRSQFDRILFHQEARIRVAEGDVEPWHEYMLDEKPKELEGLLDKIADSLDLERNTRVALKHLAFGRHRTDLRAWLAGDSLPEAALERLDLTQDDGTDEELEDVAQRAVLMLCRLAGDALPILLSFDQVEALETRPEDRDAMYGFGQLVSTLHDGTSNVLIVSAVQSTFADRLVQESRAADLDRMTSFAKLSLAGLSREDGQALIRARLDDPPVDAPFWPLNSADVDALYVQGSVTPRRLLARCADRFDDWQRSRGAGGVQVSNESGPGGDGPSDGTAAKAAPVDVPAFLAESWESMLQQQMEASQPQRSEEILRGALPVLIRWGVPGIREVVDEHLPDVNFILQETKGKVGVSVCTQPNMTSLASRLKRLKAQQQSGRLSRLVILRDGRVPLTATAKQARKHLTDLEEKGAVVLHPSIEVLAALDALRAMLADAHSGDLSCRGETIGPRTLEEWFTRHVPGYLQEFVDAVLGTAESRPTDDGDSRTVEALLTVLAGEPLLPLAQAAERLSLPTQDLAEVVRRHADLFGVIEKAEPSVFRVVPGSSNV